VGAHSYTAVITDAAGNAGTTSAAFSLTVDTTAPSATSAVTSITTDTGSLSNDYITSDQTLVVGVTVTGTVGADEIVQVSLDNGVTWHTTTLVSGSNYQYDAQATTLAEGSYTFQTRVVDAAGNASTASSQAVVIDVTGPTLSNAVAITVYGDDVAPATGDFGTGTSTNDTSPLLKGTVSGLASGDVVKIYEGSTFLGDAVVSGSTWSLQLSGVTVGAHSYTAVITDAAGNAGTTSAAFSLTVDTTGPTQTIAIAGYIDDVGASTGTFASGTTTDDRSPTLTGSLSAALGTGDVVNIYEGSTLLGTATVVGTNWTYNLSGLGDGTSHTYRAVVADSAGNEGSSANLTLTVDFTITVNSQTTTDTTPLVTGVMPFALTNGEYVEVTINGTTYSSQTGAVVVDPLNNSWYVQVPTALAIATYSVTAVIKSSGGSVITTDDTSNELIVSAAPTVSVAASASDPSQKATAYTIGENGMWRIHANQAMLDANGTNSATLGSFAKTALVSNSGGSYLGSNYVQNATFMDYNRDGYMDLFSEDSTYADGQQAFIYNGSTYTAVQVGGPLAVGGDVSTNGSANTWSWYGGIVALDTNGDGYVDLAYGDQTPADANGGGGYNSQLVLNADGTIIGMVKDGGYAYTAGGSPATTNIGNATFDMELSGVDLNNDGRIDIVYHATAGTSKIGGAGTSTATSSNAYRLVVASGTGNGAWVTNQILTDTFQRLDDDPYYGNGVALTWADYNGDGYMDLFLGRGYGSTSALQYQSRILYNDGTGQLTMSDPNSDGIGTSSGVYTFSDTLQGGPSIAVDWNGDGKMDVIELPGFGNTGGMTAAGNTGPINLYTNTTSGGVNSFTTTNLLGGSNTIGLWTGVTTTNDAVTGAIAADIDWDGDRDLLAFTQKGNTQFITNTATIADGTSLHFRIVDGNGINAFFGNTVQLYNSSGVLVASQIINAQAGNQTNDSSEIVDFYGLSASETYSVVVLRTVAGVSADIGGLATLGGNTIENVNATWTGLTTGAANAAYVLTAEASTASNNATAGNGIVGTGYNDTFFATLGTDKYEGGGGTVTVSGTKEWSNTGGVDIVDYKLAGSTALTIDLSLATAQNTGFGTATFSNIEGIAGGSGADTFTDSAADNVFDGRGGNDTFNLSHGGHDTLLYKLLAADGTGGNGSDVVNGFKVGTYEATANADRIDVSKLLVGYTADSDGAAHYINGVATMDAGETIGNYLKVTQSGSNTVISIDRDGTGSTYSETVLLTLNNVSTDLETLLANHQIVV